MSNVPTAVHVAAATLNQTVGDWEGNKRRIAEACHIARERGARLLVLPELAISGYSLGDRVWMRGTTERSWAALLELLPHTEGLITFFGLPVAHQGVLYDAMVVVVDGEPVGVVPKENLATGDVEYENRWYSGWTRGRVETFSSPDGRQLPMGSLLFEAEGVGRFAVEVCEDGWKGIRPSTLAALAGAHIIVNASASWFVLGKHEIRRQLVTNVSREDHTAYLYTSLHGCDATRLIFDGSSFIAVEGNVKAEGRRFLFTEAVSVIDHVVDVSQLELARLSEGSWRSQVERFEAGDYGQGPTLVPLTARFPEAAPPPAEPPYWEIPPAPPVDRSLQWLVDASLVPPLVATELPHLELELALCMGIREYLRKCRIPGVALALSGGRDSSMCAVLVARLLRYENPGLSAEALRGLVRDQLVTAYMASEHSGKATQHAAKALAEQLGAEHHECVFQQAVDVHKQLVTGMLGEELSWTDPKDDISLQNVQARLRGSLIWFIANLKNRLLLTTSNKSEAAVGYATMDGDTSGGLAPIADVPKSMIGPWLSWAMRTHGLDSLRFVLETPATAELRPPDRVQTDETDLMPFAVLDRLIYHFAYLGEEPVVMFQRLWPEMGERYAHDARAFAAHIRKFVRMFCQAQWKRERFAIGLRVTAFDLDPKYGFRFPAVQEPFTAELADLDAYVGRL